MVVVKEGTEEKSRFNQGSKLASASTCQICGDDSMVER